LNKGGSKGGQRGQSPPPLGQKKGKRREKGRKKKTVVSLNNFDILNIARRAMKALAFDVVYHLTT